MWNERRLWIQWRGNVLHHVGRFARVYFMHAVTLICGEGRGARVNVSLFWTVFKSEKKKHKNCSSSVLDNRQTWFIWGKKVVLRFFSVNLENYGYRLKSVSTEFLKLWALCKIYNRWAKKERFPIVKPILFKQTVTTIMCNLSASVFCSRLFTQSSSTFHFI